MKKILTILIITIVQSFGTTESSQKESITSVSDEIQTTMIDNESNSKLYREKLAMIKANQEEGRFVCIAAGFSTILNGIFTYMLWNPNNEDAFTNFVAGYTMQFTLFSAIVCVIKGIGLVIDHFAEKQWKRKFDSTNEKSSQNEVATAILTTPLYIPCSLD